MAVREAQVGDKRFLVRVKRRHHQPSTRLIAAFEAHPERFLNKHPEPPNFMTTSYIN